ncbi:MAG TPA: ankyrin repeat domain-containing protein [Thermoanaerobaculia bacterium]|jgi:ankyrin repeat protein|nr:ankyrin repeat domain-containing protein [Thermoanaerobaculia bacterium]
MRPLSLLFILWPVLGACACRTTPDEAREELAKLNVPYTSDEFVLRCGRGPTNVVALFLIAGGDPNVEVALERYVFTPLMAAAQGGRLDIAKQLVEAGARPDLRTSDGSSALDIAAADCRAPEMVQFLLAKGARPTEQCLFLAVKHELFQQSQCGLAGLEALIGAGAKVDQRRRTDHLTPLMLAADNNDLEAVRTLLRHGANPNLRGGSYDFSPLRIAVMRAMNKGRPDQLEVVKALVAAGADVNQSDRDGGTILSGLGPSPGLQPIREVLLRAGAHR